MISKKERDCISEAHKVKLAVAKNCLAELIKKGVPYDFGIDGFSWRETTSGKIMQIALLPIALLLILVSLVFTPIGYIRDLRKFNHKKLELKEAIEKMETESLSIQVPDIKVLGSLWDIHCKDLDCSFDDRVNLLNSWIVILYGTEMSANLRLRARVDKVAKIQARANDAHYADRSLPHVSFIPPIDSVIRALSSELPDYE